MTDQPDQQMEISPAAIAQLGPHPATRIGLDLHAAADREAWLLAAAILSTRAPEPALLEVILALRSQGLLSASELARRPDAAAVVLGSGPWKDPRAPAARLLRIAQSLLAHGGLDKIASEADGLEMLGAGLSGLAPGLGSASVLRFLRPLREIWPDAADVPPTPTALAAARCLGWACEGSLELGLPVDSGVAPADLEAGLERLGAAACRKGRAAGCPLGEQCPRRA